jgi:RimJ/RimL family protein N-acetyltransferase
MTEVFENSAPGPNTELFLAEGGQIADMYQQAFAGYPWFEGLSDQEVARRLENHAEQTGFTVFVEQDHDGLVAGALWFDTPSTDAFGAERGEAAKNFAEQTQAEEELPTLVWEREVLVRPEAQGRGMATRLRADMLAYLGNKYPDGALVMTRMRDDNIGIIKIAERLGYARTGIRIPSSQAAGLFHEYWYRAVK